MCQYNKKIYIAKFDDDERVKIKKNTRRKLVIDIGPGFYAQSA